MAETTQTLIFSLDEEEGALPVTDEYGRLLARVAPPWNRAHFNVSDPDGSKLCLAAATWWRSGSWTVTDLDDGTLSVTAIPRRGRAVIHREREGDLVLQARDGSDGFTILDGEGRAVAESGSASAAPAAGRRGDVVRVRHPEVLRLPDVIAVVQIWRMATKTPAASGAGASSPAIRDV